MRFAYIDSQGNEVTIPSVDALALRIELGAIGPDTQLYDAQADRWGPAHTHEIFHTLSRPTEEGGFVAPPPPVAPLAPEPPQPAAPAAPPQGRPIFDVSEDLGLPPRAEEPEATGPAAPDDLGFDFTLAEPAAPARSPAEPPAAAEEEKEEESAFDFGGLGALELESSFAEPEPSAPPPAPAGPAMDFSQGGDLGGGLTLEQPMSEFTPEAPPAWMEQSGPEPAGEGAMTFARDGDEEEEPRPAARRAAPADEPERTPRERPEPRSRPSPPRRRQRTPVAGILGGIVVLAVLGGGGWFGWQFLQGRSSAPVETAVPALPEVRIPDIPAELLPTMRDLGEAALSGTIGDLQGAASELGIPAEPNRDWLAGVYLANASQFRDVQEYWEGIEEFVNSVRDTDTRVFHDHYVAQLEAAGITGDTATMLLARADSGFLATRADRFEAYALMDDLVNASLELHRFLLQNEANIEYTPAGGGVSRDPVLEAVPASKELGDAMWDMVDGITAALDGLGTLDKVTTERLSAVLFDRIRRAGFR